MPWCLPSWWPANLRDRELRNLCVLAGVSQQPDTVADSGSNISMTGTEKARTQRERGIEPGTPEWFRRPYLTGEKPTGRTEHK